MYKLSILVVATTPLTTVVITPADAPTVFKFIIPAVVVETMPFTILVQMYELVEVDTVNTFVVLDASILLADTCCNSPLGPYTNIPAVGEPVATVPKVVLPVIAKFVAVALPICELLAFRFTVFVVDAFNICVLVVLAFTVVAVSELNIGLSVNL